eukprot:jgi/Mesvir1/17314/Mv07710-RA.1
MNIAAGDCDLLLLTNASRDVFAPTRYVLSSDGRTPYARDYALAVVGEDSLLLASIIGFKDCSYHYTAHAFTYKPEPLLNAGVTHGTVEQGLLAFYQVSLPEDGGPFSLSLSLTWQEGTSANGRLTLRMVQVCPPAGASVTTASDVELAATQGLVQMTAATSAQHTLWEMGASRESGLVARSRLVCAGGSRYILAVDAGLDRYSPSFAASFSLEAAWEPATGGGSLEPPITLAQGLASQGDTWHAADAVADWGALGRGRPATRASILANRSNRATTPRCTLATATISPIPTLVAALTPSATE